MKPLVRILLGGLALLFLWLAAGVPARAQAAPWQLALPLVMLPLVSIMTPTRQLMPAPATPRARAGSDPNDGMEFGLAAISTAVLAASYFAPTTAFRK